MTFFLARHVIKRIKKKKKNREQIEKLEVIDDIKQEQKASTGNAFGAYYLFQNKGPVIIRHQFGGSIRVNPKDNNIADMYGDSGTSSQFEVNLMNGGQYARFRSLKSGKYLRLIGNTVDIAGGVSESTIFRIYIMSKGYIKIESYKEPGKFIAVKKGVQVGTGGPWCRFLILQKGKSEPFMCPYYFDTKKVCVLETKLGTHLRVHDSKSPILLADGGKKTLAQFEIIPKKGGKECQLRSKANGKFIEIGYDSLRNKWVLNCDGFGSSSCDFIVRPTEAANYVRLESKIYKRKLIGVDNYGYAVTVDEGKKNKGCDLFTVYTQ